MNKLSIILLISASTVALEAGASHLSGFLHGSRRSLSEKKTESPQKSAALDFDPFEDLVDKIQTFGKAYTDWLPTRTITSEWDANQWKPALESSYTYTDFSELKNASILLSGYNSTIYYDNTYNDLNQLTETLISYSLDGAPVQELERVEYEYDPIVTDAYTKVLISSPGGTSYGMSREIKRNADGNVTEVTTSNLKNGVATPFERISIDYDSNQTASKISYYDLDAGGTQEITDIVWDKTNGQILNQNFYQGDNRIKSGRLKLDEDGITLQTNLKCEYKDSDYFRMALTYGGLGEVMCVEYSPLEYGGYELTISYIDDETLYDTEEYNEWGMLLYSYSETTWEDDYDMEIKEKVGEVEMGADGFPAVYTLQEVLHFPDTELTDNIYISRTEFSDYVKTTGVATPKVYEGKARYFNLQGMEIASPETGTPCIRIEGNKSEKILNR